MRFAAKIDGNQETVVTALRQAGIAVHITARLGKGFPDLVCYFRGVVRLLEVKMPGEALTEDQQTFKLFFPVDVVHSEKEALAVFGL